jgi:hypothetical protein
MNMGMGYHNWGDDNDSGQSPLAGFDARYARKEQVDRLCAIVCDLLARLNRTIEEFKIKDKKGE